MLIFQTVKLDYVGELIAGEDSAVHENRTDYSYMDLLLGSNIDKRSIQVQIEQDMVVEENCTSNCPVSCFLLIWTLTVELLKIIRPIAHFMRIRTIIALILNV